MKPGPYQGQILGAQLIRVTRVKHTHVQSLDPVLSPTDVGVEIAEDARSHLHPNARHELTKGFSF